MNFAREMSTLWANWRGDGVRMAANYFAFRGLFKVHSRPLSWLISKWAPFPLMVEVEVSTACNLRCRHCEIGSEIDWGQPPKLMPYDSFLRILDQFPLLVFVDLTGIGEPILNPRFLDMVKEVKRRGIWIEGFDHFGLWDEKVTDFMLDVKFNRIQPSVDGATKETYEFIRERADFDVVCKNLRYLFQQKKERGCHLPTVDFHFIVMDHNEHELVQFVRLVRELAGDQRVGLQFTEVLREFPGIRAKKVPITERHMAEVRAEAKRQRIQVWFNRNSEGRPKADMRQCSAYLMPFTFISGDVVPCCAQNEAGNRPLQIQRAMGNIFQQSFRDIWKGGPYTELRRKMRRGETPDYCEECPVFKAKKSGL